MVSDCSPNPASRQVSAARDKRAGEHESELAADQAATGELGLGAALFGEWDVGAAGVATELGPLGLTMANENDLVGGHARSLPRAEL